MKPRAWLVWFLIFSFLSTSFSLSSVEAANTTKKIQIPEQYGAVLYQSEGKSGPLVILIQDAHAQYEAQTQIKNILNYLIQNHSVKLVGLEGGTGPLHPEYFDFFEDKNINLKIADSLLQEGELSGAELAAIENPLIQWVGVENIRHYRDNLLQFQSVYKNSEATEKNQIAKLKQKHFNKELLKFDTKRTRYYEGRDGLLGYIKYLEKKTGHQFDPKNSGAEEFFNEIREVENQIYSKLIRTSLERDVIEKANKTELLEKLSRLQLSRVEYFELKNSKNRHLGESLKFYEQTIQRDKILTSNLLSSAAKQRQDIAVLVSGGFHTPGIETILREKNIPHITIIPKFSALSKNSNYLKTILNQSTWLENKSGLFNNKIAPALLLNESRVYPQLNSNDPNRQRKVLAGAFLKALSTTSNTQTVDNPFFYIVSKEGEVIISPKTHLTRSDFFAAQQYLKKTGTPATPPTLILKGSSLGSDPPIVQKLLDSRTADGISSIIHRAFISYTDKYKEITANAQNLFETRNWKQVLNDARTRISLYRLSLDITEKEVRDHLKDRAKDQALWLEIKIAFLHAVANSYDSDLALTYFYSVMRRMHLDSGTSIEYTDDGIKEDHEQMWKKINKPYKAYSKQNTHTKDLVKKILLDREFKSNYGNIDQDAELIAERIEEKLTAMTGSKEFDSIEILNPTFFRNKGAYIAGRIRKEGTVIPLVFALLNPDTGMEVDAVLMDEKNVSNVFSYSRANFHVDISVYRELGDFLESIIPKKGRAAIYSTIGFIHPGKIELVKELRSQIRRYSERFEQAKGIKGWVMIAFTLPSFPYVFKIIADYSEKEGVSKGKVKQNYERVHETDRAGRMLDSLTYKNLRFDKDLFTAEVLEEIKRRAPNELIETKENGEESIVLKHVYVQRKVIPLNIYLKEHETDKTEIQRVLEDWGFCIKGLAAAGLWPGDFKPNNFGVTATGRVVSFDYDELETLTDLNFENIIRWQMPSDEEDGYAVPGTAWHDRHVYHRVNPRDEFAKMDLSTEFENMIHKAHPDLFDADYWQGIQDQIREGKLPDVFPYALNERLIRPKIIVTPQNKQQSTEGQSLGLKEKLNTIVINSGLKQSA